MALSADYYSALPVKVFYTSAMRRLAQLDTAYTRGDVSAGQTVAKEAPQLLDGLQREVAWTDSNTQAGYLSHAQIVDVLNALALKAQTGRYYAPPTVGDKLSAALDSTVAAVEDATGGPGSLAEFADRLNLTLGQFKAAALIGFALAVYLMTRKAA